MFSNENDKLENLINVNKDASEFYEEAVDIVEDQNIKNTFQEMKRAHDSVVIDVCDYLKSKGERPDEAEETLIGEARQMWGTLMTKISSDVDETLVTHLEEAEDRCLHTIQDVMADEEIDADTRAMLQNKYATLRGTHDHMKALKEQIKQAA